MRIMKNRRIALAVVALLVVGLLVPATAFAAPGNEEAPGTGTKLADAAAAQYQKGLEGAVNTALRLRANQYNEADEKLNKYVQRLELLAGQAKQLGADEERIDHVRERLMECQQTLVQAKYQEQAMIKTMLGVPRAQNKGETFYRALQQAKASVKTMYQAKNSIKDVAEELEEIIEDLD
jgi:glutathionylspermidine synthase